MDIFEEPDLSVLIETPELTIEQVVNRAILDCTPDESVASVAERMSCAGCSSIVVMEGDVPVGIWTEHDVLSLNFDDPQDYLRPIRDLMSSPVITVEASTTLQEVASRFLADGVRHFLVQDKQGVPQGVITQTDVILNQGVEHFLRLRQVSSVVNEGTVTLPASASLAEASARMREANRDAILVHYPESDEYGILTERDIVRLVAKRLSGIPIGEFASRPLVTTPSDSSLYRARDTLLQKGLRHLGVMQNDHVVGLLSFSDILFGLEHIYVKELRQALSDRDRVLAISRHHLHLAERIIESSLEGIMVTDATGVITSVNPAFTHMTGYAPEEVIGKGPSILSSGRHDKEFYAEMWQSIRANGNWQGEVWNRRKNGEVYPERLTIAAIYDDEGGVSHYASLFSDITKLKEDEEHIRSLAYFDPLTNLPNRRLFNDRLSVALSHASRHHTKLAVIFVDLDRFKRINDTLGHDVGDELLVEVSRRLSSVVREDDTVARMGGDEFILLLSDVGELDSVTNCARRFIDVMSRPVELGERELMVTCSVGISLYPEDGEDIESLVKNADTAMYRAKEAGRNNYQLYSPAMNTRSLEHLAMEMSLHRALERQEFEVFYQPLIDAMTEQLIGAEALLRWNHPELGRVPPADFIPLAEETGQIVPIGEFVMRQVCRQLARWHEQGYGDMDVAVNVSARQFHDKTFLPSLERVVAEEQVDIRQINLEITESLLMGDANESIRLLDALRAMGFSLSVDDFGTGYSSLSYLRRFPISKLKIDRAFIRDIVENDEDGAIVSAVIKLGHSLGLNVVAEGVEKEAQLHFLQSHGCDVIQGFYYSPPVDTKSFEEKYLKRRVSKPA